MVSLSLSRKSERVRIRKVLVVEDDAVLGLAIEQVLSDTGEWDVTICPTVSCTLGTLRDGAFDAIVIDGHLADSDEGWELAELVDALGHDHMRIVFQTGSPQDIPVRIRELGPVLNKPYDPNDLVEALRQKQKPGLVQLVRSKLAATKKGLHSGE